MLRPADCYNLAEVQEGSGVLAKYLPDKFGFVDNLASTEEENK